jgi:hypothetical protein
MVVGGVTVQVLRRVDRPVIAAERMVSCKPVAFAVFFGLVVLLSIFDEPPFPFQSGELSVVRGLHLVGNFGLAGFQLLDHPFVCLAAVLSFGVIRGIAGLTIAHRVVSSSMWLLGILMTCVHLCSARHGWAVLSS